MSITGEAGKDERKTSCLLWRQERMRENKLSTGEAGKDERKTGWDRQQIRQSHMYLFGLWVVDSS